MWKQTVTWPFYFDNSEQIFAQWEKDLHEEKCVPSSISLGNIFDELENQFDWIKIFSIEEPK